MSLILNVRGGANQPKLDTVFASTQTLLALFDGKNSGLTQEFWVARCELSFPNQLLNFSNS
ncbi:MAG TPA: hypothetical protein DCL61_26410 [Cyanobacteria bacterium UBA12227]|nr:hypothetical protein [Cyanobacteria bacterium UBA12227]HAX89965.1 hypothetical protein [Cyanobacteria bacterium UBA11370]HBY80744.1 hypothetical protein [Cyanobacteria bacterium UBA11148]